MGIRRLVCRGDSDLVVKQVMKTFDTKDSKMVVYCTAVHELEGNFDDIELHHVKRNNNMEANNFAWMGAARDPVPEETFL